MLKRQVVPRSRWQRHKPRLAAFGSAPEVTVDASHSYRALTIRYVLATLLVIPRSLSPASYLHWYHDGARYGHVVKTLIVLGLRLYQKRVRRVIGPAVVGPTPTALVTRARVTLVSSRSLSSLDSMNHGPHRLVRCICVHHVHGNCRGPDSRHGHARGHVRVQSRVLGARCRENA